MTLPVERSSDIEGAAFHARRRLVALQFLEVEGALYRLRTSAA